MKNYVNDKVFFKSLSERDKIIKEINETSTEQLFERGGLSDLYKKCKKIVIEKYNNNKIKNLTEEEKEIFKKAINYIHGKIPNNQTMIRVVPQCEIKKYITFKYDLRSFMIREVDFNNITSINRYKNKSEALINCLALNYPESNFKKEDRYIGVLRARLPKFCIRTPISEAGIDCMKNQGSLIIKEMEGFYTGVGFTAHEDGVMEFYVSISNDVNVTEGTFPINAFYTDIFLIDKFSDEKFLFASYDNETYEGQNMFDKFMIKCENDKVVKQVANELKLEDYLFE